MMNDYHGLTNLISKISEHLSTLIILRRMPNEIFCYYENLGVFGPASINHSMKSGNIERDVLGIVFLVFFYRD